LPKDQSRPNLASRSRRVAVKGEHAVRITTVALLLAGFAFATNTASAVTTDDVKWINACVKDNKGGASDGVILKYCTCMNEKMDNNETQSITQWEKTHVTERKACDKESGWK
jgi:hypothetical protein